MANPTYAEAKRAIIESRQVSTLLDGTKVKERAPRMRACNEKNEKGKLCAGHLKRWYFFGDEIKNLYGEAAEIYRCEKCRTIYLPNAAEAPRTGTLAW
ncbi:MAG: hypothetical protein ABI972_16285 [Acidobacteriota bacterium]